MQKEDKLVAEITNLIGKHTLESKIELGKLDFFTAENTTLKEKCNNKDKQIEDLKLKLDVSKVELKLAKYQFGERGINGPDALLLSRLLVADLKDLLKKLDKDVVISHYRTKDLLTERLAELEIEWDDLSKAQIVKILTHK